MRVLSVAVALDQGQIQLERVWKRAGGRCGVLLLHQIGSDRSVVGGGMLEGFDGQPAAQLCPHPPCGQGIGERWIICRVTDDGDVRVVFGCSPQQGHAADVDLLDRGRQRHVGVRHSLLEGIEVDHDQVDRADSVLGQFVQISCGTAGQDGAVDGWVQCLDPSPQNFRKSGDCLHRLHGQPGGSQLAGGPTAGDQLPAGGDQLRAP